MMTGVLEDWALTAWVVGSAANINRKSVSVGIILVLVTYAILPLHLERTMRWDCWIVGQLRSPGGDFLSEDSYKRFFRL